MNELPLYAADRGVQPGLAAGRPAQLLGGLSPRDFMRTHWQKKPLLIRQALSPEEMRALHFPLSPDALIKLAKREDVESRLIAQTRGRWSFSQGPFSERPLPSRKTRNWTLLVQGVNLVEPAVEALMQRFRFIPDARLDDVMISYATDGGGVGPHFDSYDVFLLQAHGQRRWRISSQDDLTLVPDLPLKILANFTPEEEFVLEPGDMLYLPPHYAHDGVAEGDCMTYSIGFRSPSYRELAGHFLGFLSQTLEDNPDFEGRYTDPDQKSVERPGELPVAMVRALAQKLNALRWTPELVGEFLGAYLTEPKDHVEFVTQPRLSLARFTTRARKEGIVLDARTQALYDTQRFWINGDTFEPPDTLLAWLSALSDQRGASAETVDAATDQPDLMDTLHAWYEEGWLRLAGPGTH
ncbi:cupin domain-containing protein [Ralstonia solanacearum]|uniref:ribosomal protein uL16 3-hydroxylase n=1 Tax=Ralstonia solanacearum TaxID=305 RepID=UPI0006DC572B|nr:cupin domain-containing protein [Ralstonia solanacearum]